MNIIRRLAIFPDTNLFLQCSPLEELPWAALGLYDEIEIIVSRPVQREIDRHKGGGNERRQRRARAAASRLRQALDGKPIVIKEYDNGLVVKLSLRVALRPDPDLATRLDYAEPDDALVGIAHGFVHSERDTDVAVLTDDTGVMASAAAAPMKYIAIPENWILPPDRSREAKELTAANAEIARLKKDGPIFLLNCVGGSKDRAAILELELPIAPPLGENEIVDLVQLANARFPLKASFDQPTGPSNTDVGGDISALMGMHSPPSHDQINRYRRVHARWNEELKVSLQGIHERLLEEQKLPIVTFVAENTGSRPATDVLVEFAATGSLLVAQPLHENDSRMNEEELPQPPAPPTFHYSGLAGLLQAGARLPGPMALSDFRSLGGRDRGRDPEVFYYKTNRFASAADRLELQCELWRHGIEPENFEARLFAKDGQTDVVDGIIEFRIHASNLSDVARLPQRVRLVPKMLSTADYARNLISRLQPVDTW